MYLYLILAIITAQLVLADDIIQDLACEHESMVLKCPKGYVINTRKAVYGKLIAYYCSAYGNHVTDCAAGNTLDTVKSRCDQRETCTMKASNDIFGDPCPRTLKYLDVSYECVLGDIQTKVVCENNEMHITCPEEYHIRISNALYGRMNQVYCTGPDRNVKSNRCNSARTLGVVESMCDNQQECKLNASNDLFGDPCSYTFKYLEVNYQCLSGPGKKTDSKSADGDNGNESENQIAEDKKN